MKIPALILLCSFLGGPRLSAAPPLQVETPDLTCGVTVQGEISVIGEKDSFRFEAAAGEAVEVAGEGIDRTIQLYIRILDPQGQPVGEKSIASTRSGAVALKQSGLYTLQVSDYLNEKTGRYNLTLQFVSGRCAVPIGCEETIPGPVSRRGELKAFGFDAAAGETIRAAASVQGNPAHAPSLRLYGPQGTPVGTLQRGLTDGLTLPVDGRYTLIAGDFFSFFEPTRSDTFNVSLEFTTGRCARGAEDGQALETPIHHDLQQSGFAFNGAQGTWVNLSTEALDYGSWNPTVTLSDHSGRALETVTGGSLDFFLTADGPYQATVLTRGASGRRYRLRLSLPGKRQYKLSPGIFQQPLQAAAVATNSRQAELLVAYVVDFPGTGEFEVYAQRLDAVDFSPLGAEIRVSDMGPEHNPAFGARDPGVAYNDATGEYLVVWSGDDDRDGDFEIFGQRLDGATGTPLGSNDFPISSTGPAGDAAFGAYHPRIAVSTVNHDYLVIWHGGRTATQTFDVQVRRLDPSGTPTGAALKLNTASCSPRAAFPDLAYNPDRNEYLAVWQSLGSAAGVWGRRLAGAGGGPLQASEVLLSHPSAAASPTDDRPGPSVAYNSVQPGYLVAWPGSDGALYGQRLSPTADPLSIAADVPLTLAGSHRLPRIAFNPLVNQFLLVWQRDLPGGDTEIRGQRLAGDSGRKIGDLGGRLSVMGPRDVSGFAARRPEVLFNPASQEFFIVWEGNNLLGRGFQAAGASFPGRAATGPGTLSWMLTAAEVQDPAHPSPFRGLPTLDAAGGLLTYGGAGGLTALQPDGSIDWSLPASGFDTPAPAAPMLAGDQRIVAHPTADPAATHLSAYDAQGHALWESSATAAAWFPLAADRQGNLLAAAEGGPLVALHPDGTPRWQTIPTGYEPAGAPVLDHNGNGALVLRRLADNGPGALWAFDSAGQTRWLHPLDWTPGNDFPLAVAADGSVFVGGPRLAAFTPEGTLRWTAPLAATDDDVVECAPSITPDGIILCAAGPSVQGFDRSGANLFHLSADSQQEIFSGTPALGSDGSIYVTSTLPAEAAPHGLPWGKVYALTPDRRIAWKREIEGDDFSGAGAVAAPDGTLYLISSRGSLYALRTAAAEPRPTAWAAAGGNPQHTNQAALSGDVSLYFAQFAAAGTALGSQIFLVNPDPDRSQTARVSLRDDAGAPLSLTLNGTPVSGNLEVTIPPTGLRVLSTDDLAPLTIGAATVTAGGNLGGVLLFGGGVGLAGVGSSIEISDTFLAPIETDAALRINTGVAFMNLSDQAVALHGELVDQQGQVIARAQLSGNEALKPHGHRALFVNDIPWDSNVDLSRLVGILRVTPSGPVSATVLQTRPQMLATMPVTPGINRQWGKLLGSDAGGTRAATIPFPYQLNFAHFADGAGLFSQLILFNLDESAAVTARLWLRDDQGAPLTAQLNGMPVDGMLELTLPPAGAQVLRTPGRLLDAVLTGSAQLESSGPLGGVLLFGGSIGLAGVGSSQEIVDGFLAPVQTDRLRRIDTGIAIMNLEDTPQTLSLELCDQEGSVVAQATLSGTSGLPAGGHLAKFVGEIFAAAPPDLSHFSGLLRVTGSGRLAATVLQTRPGQFATMPVIPFQGDGLTRTSPGIPPP